MAKRWPSRTRPKKLPSTCSRPCKALHGDRLNTMPTSSPRMLKVLPRSCRSWMWSSSTMTVLKPLELWRTFFYAAGRQPQQTLLSYAADHREKKREVERHGIKVPESISGWLFLRRAGLTADQRHLVMSQCGSNTETMKVEEVMYFFFGQDYRTSAPRWTSSRSTTNSWPRYNKNFNRAYMALLKFLL